MNHTDRQAAKRQNNTDLLAVAEQERRECDRRIMDWIVARDLVDELEEFLYREYKRATFYDCYARGWFGRLKRFLGVYAPYDLADGFDELATIVVRTYDNAHRADAEDIHSFPGRYPLDRVLYDFLHETCGEKVGGEQHLHDGTGTEADGR